MNKKKFDPIAYQKEWRRKNREKINEQQRKRRDENSDQKRAVNKTYRSKNGNKIHANWIKSAYGITADEYNYLFIKQEGKCAICKQHQGTLPKRLSVDHCHETGKIRGLLCNKCNVSLGNFNDDISLLKEAIKYLVFNGKDEQD